MGIEWERKWRFKKEAEGAEKFLECLEALSKLRQESRRLIEQGYLWGNTHSHKRLRKVVFNDGEIKYIETRKAVLNHLVGTDLELLGRKEVERKIKKETFWKKYFLLLRQYIKKDVIDLVISGVEFELHYFKGRNEGLILLEKEFTSGAECGAFNMPESLDDFFEEVTLDKNYLNINLAKDERRCGVEESLISIENLLHFGFKKPIKVLVFGPSGNGKGWIIKKIKECFKGAVVHEADMYYRGLEFMRREKIFNEQGDLDFDNPRAIDWGLLGSHIKKVSQGEGFYQPVYDFSTGQGRVVRKPDYYKKPSQIHIFDSLFPADKYTGEKFDLVIYIDAVEPLAGIIRRWDRDQKRAQMPLEDIQKMIEDNVMPNYIRYIAPEMERAHLIINNPFSVTEIKKAEYLYEQIKYRVNSLLYLPGVTLFKVIQQEDEYFDVGVLGQLRLRRERGLRVPELITLAYYTTKEEDEMIRRFKIEFPARMRTKKFLIDLGYLPKKTITKTRYLYKGESGLEFSIDLLFPVLPNKEAFLEIRQLPENITLSQIERKFGFKKSDRIRKTYLEMEVDNGSEKKGNEI